MAIPDVRQYGTEPTPGGTEFSPLAGPANDLYSRVILSTPGLIHYWRLGYIETAWHQGWNDAVFENWAGQSTLNVFDDVTVTTGLIVGSDDGAALFSASGGGNLMSGDYYITSPGSTSELFTQEVWVNLTAAALAVGDFSLGGAWNGTYGWMVYYHVTNGLSLYIGNKNWQTGIELEADTTYHVVFVYGGPVDYPSFLFVNGDLVATKAKNDGLDGFPVISILAHMEIGSYNETSAAHALDGVVDELALYSRMLQPDEITQHYQAGLGVLWP